MNHFVSFATTDLYLSLRRIKFEAKKLNFFDEYHLFTENDLDESFRKKHKDILNPQHFGYGYFIWKPFVIRKVLNKLHEGDYLIYLDAGCEINYRAKRKLNYYLRALDHSKGFMASQLISDFQIENRLTKQEVFDFFKIDPHSKIGMTPQIEAGALWIKKNSFSVKIIDQWFKICDTHTNLIDSKTYDQPILSIICKMNNIETFKAYDHYPNRSLVNINFFEEYTIKLRNDDRKLFLFARNLRFTIMYYIKTKQFNIILRNLLLDFMNIFIYKIYGYKIYGFRKIFKLFFH